MSSDVELKRREIRNAYFGLNWQQKVDKMSDSQVIAVYLRLKNQGKI